MDARGLRGKRELTAIAVLPNRGLAARFLAALSATKTAQVLAELKSYPPSQTLDIRIRQFRPDMAFIDFSANPEQAAETVRFVASIRPAVYVVAVDEHNTPDAILRAVRAGATEFLYAPFGAEMQQEAVERIRRLLEGDQRGEPERGKLLLFSNAKPGSGASTLAAQTAFALERLTRTRVLLADLDLWGGTLGFFLKLRYRATVLDAIRESDRLDPARWLRLVVAKDGVDVLPAPDMPGGQAVEAARLHDLLEFALASYDWVVCDAPGIFEKLSLLALTSSDGAYVVTTSELPSLHLTRKAATFLLQVGFGPERFRVLVNRVSRKDGINTGEMSKIFNAPVHAAFPNDYASLHQALAEGRAVTPPCAIGKAMEEFAARIAGEGSRPAEKDRRT